MLPSALANDSAEATASLIWSVSPIWPQASAAWSFLSIEADSTCRKKPFFLPSLLAVSRSIALSVIAPSDGTSRQAGFTVHDCAGRPAPPEVASSSVNLTGMLPGLNRPSTGASWLACRTPARSDAWVRYV